MADSVQKDRGGSDWPLGVIVVATPGTPVGIMILVDPNSYNAPETAVPQVPALPSNEYTVVAQQIMFQAFKKDSHGLTMNTGNIYVVRRGAGGAGNRDDYGSIVAVISPGETFFLASAPLNLNVLSPYRYFIDADNASDAALVTLIIQ